MESKDRTLKSTSKTQQVAVISKMHNMQWLKNNTHLPGHIKSRTIKRSLGTLKEELEPRELVACGCERYTESEIDEKLVVSGHVESILSIEDKIEKASILEKQKLILKELDEPKMISIATSKSLVTAQVETQCRLEEQEKNENIMSGNKEQHPNNALLRDSLDVKGNANEANIENVHDKNNNDTSNNIIESSSKIDKEVTNNMKYSDIKSDIGLRKDDNQKEKNDSINLNKKTNISIDSKSIDKTPVIRKNTFISSSSRSSNMSGESKKPNSCEDKHPNEKKEMWKVVQQKSVITCDPNKCKDETGVTIKKTPDKKDSQPSHPMSSTSKGLVSTCIPQSRKESAPKCAVKNLKEIKQDKTAPSSSIDKQQRINRICYTAHKEDHGAIPKIHTNSPKTIPHAIKGRNSNSNLPSLVPSKVTVQSNAKERHSVSSKEPLPSNANNKHENMQHKQKLESDKGTKLSAVKQQSINESGIDNKLRADKTNETNQSNAQNVCTNPFMQDISNMRSDVRNIKDNAYNDFCANGTQLENLLSTDTLYTPQCLQQNAYQEQTPSHQDFVSCTPNQFIANCSVNNTIPKCNSNISYVNPNVMHLNHYGNMIAMKNEIEESKFHNLQNPNVLPANAENINMLQYQMPNMSNNPNNPNMIRSQPGFCIHPMTTQEEQFNMHTFGMNPTYLVNPFFVCRNECYLPHPPNWNVSGTYPVSLVPDSYQFNCNPFCNQHVPSNNGYYKNPVVARPIQGRVQPQVFHEQNLQANCAKPICNSGYNARMLQSNKIYDTNFQIQGIAINMQEKIGFKQEKQDDAFLNDKEMSNLPMISPKACMIYGTGVPTNTNAARHQTKHSETTEPTPNPRFQYQRNNGRCYVSKEYASNAGIGHGKAAFRQQGHPNYKEQY